MNTQLNYATESVLYDSLLRYIVPASLLERYGYPVPDPSDSTMCKVPSRLVASRVRKGFDSPSTCSRCGQNYEVDSSGMPLYIGLDTCVHHPKKITRYNGYICCGLPSGSRGCTSHTSHIQHGDYLIERYQGFVRTYDKPELEPNRHGVFALDCEMCCTTHGYELMQVIVLNAHERSVVYKKLVKPANPILDYNTRFSGMKESDLIGVTTTLRDVQDDLLNLFSSKTLIIGHGLDHDMEALKMFHTHVIDTTQLYPHRMGLPYKRALKTISEVYLGQSIQNGQHNIEEDARSALQLVMLKARQNQPYEMRI